MILIIEQGPNTGQRWSVDKPDVTIGRDNTCDVSVQDPRVSRRHAQLWRQGDAWTVRDLNSRNGTWVNGQRLTSPRALQRGDQLAIGQTVFSLQWGPELARKPAPSTEKPLVSAISKQASSAQPGGTVWKGDLRAGLTDAVIALAALFMVIGAGLPWIRVTVSVLGANIAATASGRDGAGSYTLIGGGLSLALALGALTLRGLVVTRGDGPTLRWPRRLLRWSALVQALIGAGMLVLMVLGLLRYYRSANREVFLGIRLIELVKFAGKWLNLKIIPQIGLILTVGGLALLLLGAAVRLAVAALFEQPILPASQD